MRPFKTILAKKWSILDMSIKSAMTTLGRALIRGVRYVIQIEIMELEEVSK